MDETKLQGINRLIGAFDTNAMSQDQIIKGFKSIIKHVEDNKELTKKELELIRQAYKDMLKERDDSQRNYDADFEASQMSLMGLIEAKLETIKDGKDGRDGKDGEDGLDGRDGKDGENGKDGFGDASTLRYLEEEIAKLKDRMEGLRTARGGGTSAIGVAQTFKWIAHTEAPVGVIDGANTSYTVKNNIWWIAGFTLNGEQIAQLPNFTYAGRTITFATALPAAYSGKDFEIKYIGT